MKRELVKLLKDQFSAGFAKLRTDSYPYDKYKCIDARDTGKRFLAVAGPGVGPMTITTAYVRSMNETMEKVKPSVLSLFDSDTIKRIIWDSDGSTYDVSKDGKVYTLEFRWELYAANSSKLNLDSGYRNYWLRVILKDKVYTKIEQSEILIKQILKDHHKEYEGTYKYQYTVDKEGLHLIVVSPSIVEDSVLDRIDVACMKAIDIVKDLSQIALIVKCNDPDYKIEGNYIS